MSGVRVPCRAHANAAPMHRHMIFLYSRNANVICDISGVCILPYAQIAYIHIWPYSMMQESGPTSRHDFFFLLFFSLLLLLLAMCTALCKRKCNRSTMRTRKHYSHSSERQFFFCIVLLYSFAGTMSIPKLFNVRRQSQLYYVCKFVCICAAFTRP